ncbi:unnamed protein product [Ectocarpus sp. 4 AP-2014]
MGSGRQYRIYWGVFVLLIVFWFGGDNDFMLNNIYIIVWGMFILLLFVFWFGGDNIMHFVFDYSSTCNVVVDYTVGGTRYHTPRTDFQSPIAGIQQKEWRCR